MSYMSAVYDQSQFEAPALTVEEFLAWARISRSKFYREVRAGKIPVTKLGKKSLIRRRDAMAWCPSSCELEQMAV